VEDQGFALETTKATDEDEDEGRGTREKGRGQGARDERRGERDEGERRPMPRSQTRFGSIRETPFADDAGEPSRQQWSHGVRRRGSNRSLGRSIAHPSPPHSSLSPSLFSVFVLCGITPPHNNQGAHELPSEIASEPSRVARRSRPHELNFRAHPELQKMPLGPQDRWLARSLRRAADGAKLRRHSGRRTEWK